MARRGVRTTVATGRICRLAYGSSQQPAGQFYRRGARSHCRARPHRPGRRRTAPRLRPRLATPMKRGMRPTGQARDGHVDGLSARGRPQARRLRRSAPQTPGLRSATSREAGLQAVDGSVCPVTPRSGRNECPSVEQWGSQLGREEIASGCDPIRARLLDPGCGAMTLPKPGPRDDAKLAAIKLEWWPRSDRNRWPPSLESALSRCRRT